MREALLDKWNGLTGREKFFCVAALCALLMYAAYAVVLEGLMRDIAGKKVRLARLDAEYEKLRSGSRHQEELKEELAMLKLELLKKKNEEHELHEGSQSRPPADMLLHELRRTAGSMPLQLVEMNVANGLASAAGTAAYSSERPTYSVSNISLSYRSGYRDAVNYHLKVIDLPYAISVKTVEMVRANQDEGLKKKLNATRIAAGETSLYTRLELEIYYR